MCHSVFTLAVAPSTLRPPRGSLKLVFTKFVNFVPLGQCHHKPMGMYGGDIVSRPPPYILMGLCWHYSNDTWSISLVKMSSTDPRGGLKWTQYCLGLITWHATGNFMTIIMTPSQDAFWDPQRSESRLRVPKNPEFGSDHQIPSFSIVNKDNMSLV